MSRSKLTCFLPCRKGSERVPRKNIKPFAGHHHGLVEIKLRQLANCAQIDSIILSTDDEEIIAFATGLKLAKLEIYKRDNRLAQSTTSTDELIPYINQIVDEGDILWTHVTSPFVCSKTYGEIISLYHSLEPTKFDSLMTVSEIHSFLWDENGPINYNRSDERWPRTQTLSPVYEINSAVFIAPKSVYSKFSDRIGVRPYRYALNKVQAFDIDWPDDFALAELIAESRLKHV